jgi:hypothetical protein
MKIAARTSQITKHSLAGLTLATGIQDANSSLSLHASRVEETGFSFAISAAILDGDNSHAANRILFLRPSKPHMERTRNTRSRQAIRGLCNVTRLARFTCVEMV